MLRQRCVASDHVLLDDDAAADGFDGAVENRNKAVAGGFDQPAVVFGDAGLEEIALDPLDAVVRSFFVELHQAAVAGDIACHDRRKTARRCCAAWRLAMLARFKVANFAHGPAVSTPANGV